MPIIDEKLDGNVKTVYFEETPVMSTYLVAVVVGLFDHIEDTTADGMSISNKPVLLFDINHFPVIQIFELVMQVSRLEHIALLVGVMKGSLH